MTAGDGRARRTGWWVGLGVALAAIPPLLTQLLPSFHPRAPVLILGVVSLGIFTALIAVLTEQSRAEAAQPHAS